MAEPSDSSNERANAASDRSPTRAMAVRVVIVTDGSTAPAPLLEALADRGVDVERALDVFDAMATVVRAASDLRQRRANESANSTEANLPVALLLVEPASLDRAQELVRAVRVYAPGIVVWRYDARAAIPLRGYDDVDGPLATQPTGAADAEVSMVEQSEPRSPVVVTRRARPKPQDAHNGHRDAPEPRSEPSEPRLRLMHVDDEPEPDEKRATDATDACDATGLAVEPSALSASDEDRVTTAPLDAAPEEQSADTAAVTPEELAMLLDESDNKDAGDDGKGQR